MSKVAEITFKEKVENKNADFDVMYIIDNLYWNGQIYKNYIIEKNKDTYKATVILTNSEALDKKYWPREVEDLIRKFDIDYKIGEDEVLNWKKDCDCIDSSFYVINPYLNMTCGDCLDEVSLIKFPELDQDDRYEISLFFKFHDALQNLSNYDEEYCKKEIRDPNSKLTNMGRELCFKISNKINKPVYYLLISEENVSVCPKCGKVLDNLPIDITKYSDYNIDKVCKECNLVFQNSILEDKGE